MSVQSWLYTSCKRWYPASEPRAYRALALEAARNEQFSFQVVLRNVAEHGLDMITVPVFTPPLDGVKRPTQLLRVSPKPDGTYRFDWTDVRRWLTLAKACGIHRFEWTHPFTQWGVRHAIRIYAGQGEDETLLWPPETAATGPVYRAFLAQFLPELKAFLDDEGLLEHSVFHVSDEPHSEEDKAHYKAARALLKELAPWMKTGLSATPSWSIRVRKAPSTPCAGRSLPRACRTTRCCRPSACPGSTACWPRCATSTTSPSRKAGACGRAGRFSRAPAGPERRGGHPQALAGSRTRKGHCRRALRGIRNCA